MTGTTIQKHRREMIIKTPQIFETLLVSVFLQATSAFLVTVEIHPLSNTEVGQGRPMPFGEANGPLA